MPTQLRNWLARRRVAISLIGFVALSLYNVFGRQTIPNNPLHLSNGWTIASWGLVLGGLAIRSWSAGTLSKSRDLTTWGPYALSRNPLYLGSFLMMFGFCVFCKDWYTLAFIAGPMTLLYFAQVEFEEVRLSKMFPQEWPSYFSSTPKLFPTRYSKNVWRSPSAEEWIRNREYRAIVATGIGVAAVVGWYYLRISLVS